MTTDRPPTITAEQWSEIAADVEAGRVKVWLDDNGDNLEIYHRRHDGSFAYDNGIEGGVIDCDPDDIFVLEWTDQPAAPKFPAYPVHDFMDSEALQTALDSALAENAQLRQQLDFQKCSSASRLEIEQEYARQNRDNFRMLHKSVSAHNPALLEGLDLIDITHEGDKLMSWALRFREKESELVAANKRVEIALTEASNKPVIHWQNHACPLCGEPIERRNYSGEPGDWMIYCTGEQCTGYWTDDGYITALETLKAQEDES